MKNKRTLLLILFLLICLDSLNPFLCYTSDSGLHSITIISPTIEKYMRDKTYYMYFPTDLSGEFTCPSTNGYHFNAKFITLNYPIELYYDFTCYKLGSGDYHDHDTTLRFSLYDEQGNFERNLLTVSNRNGGRRTGSITIPANKGVKLAYFTGKWYFRTFFKTQALRAYSGNVNITYRTDEERPPEPTGVKVDNAVEISDKVYFTNSNPVVVRWNEVVDKGNPASGIDIYTLRCGSKTVTLKTNTNIDTGNKMFPIDGEYSLQVKATDLAGLESGYSSYRFYVDRTKPRGSFNINSGQAYTNNRLVVLNLQANDAGGSGVIEMRFKNEEGTYSAWEEYLPSKDWFLPDGDGLKKVYVQYRDYVGNISDEYYHQIILDTTPPTGTVNIVIDDSRMKVVNGSKYIKSAESVDLELSATDHLSDIKYMQFSNDGENYTLPVYFRQIEKWNLPAGDGEKVIYVRFIDGAGNLSDQEGTIIKDTIILDTTAPGGTVTINDGKGYTNSCQVALNLKADDGDGIGIEKMCFSNDGKNYSHWEDFKAVKEWSLSGAEDGVATVYILYQDVLGNITENALETTILLDQKEPKGSFNITSRDGSRVFNQERPANTIQVKLNILELSDTGSGVSGIYLWNGSQTNPPDKAVFFESSPTLVEQGIDWELLSETGMQTVNMLVCDRAGNVFHYPYTLQLNKTIPPSPDLKTFRHTPNQFGASEEHTTINFFWEATDEQQNIEGFVGSYIIDGIEKDFSPNQIQTTVMEDKIQGRVALDVTGLGSNQPVKIKIRSISKAGNESAEKTYTAWTKASLGQLSFLNGGYDEHIGTHYLSWRLIDQKEAAGHLLEAGELIQDVFNVKREIQVNAKGIFTLTGLTTRQAGYYRLVALNGSNDKTIGQLFYKSVPNLPPTSPQLLSPQGFTRSAVEFKFKEAKDYDGDLLRYDLYFAIGANPSDADFEMMGSITKAEMNEGITLKKNDLKHSQSYTWYVVADDGNSGRTSSEKLLFTVDTVPPELVIEQPERPYTSRRLLQVMAIDQLSGIDKLVYKKIDNGGLDISAGEVYLTPSAEGLMSGKIDLDEGCYHLHVTLYDQAGNLAAQNFNNLCVDYTVPQFLNAALEMEIKDGKYIGNSSRIPLHFKAVDNLSLIKGLHYRFLADPNLEEGVGGFLTLSPDLQEYMQFLEFTAYDGHEYYVAVWMEDKAGNLSETKFLGPIFMDRTPPEIALTAEGFNFHGGQYYLKNLEILTVNTVAEDDESGIKEIEYAVVLADNNKVISNWAQWPMIQNTPLEIGRQYRITARVSNGVGLTKIDYSQEFTYDDTPPEISKFIGPKYDLASGEEGVFEIWAQDQESGIIEYRLALGSLPGACDISTQIAGNEDGWLIKSSPQIPAIFKEELPELDDGIYYTSVIVKNGAGDEIADNISFAVNNSQEKVIVVDQGPYTSITDRMVCSWYYLGERITKEFRYRILDKNNTPITDWVRTTKNEESSCDLDLQLGALYRFEVQAIFIEGDYSASGFSHGVIVDNTPPAITEIITPTFTTSDQLWFQWEGEDQESSINSIQVALGSDYMLADITKGWVEITEKQTILSCDLYGTKLNLLTNTKYYLTLRLINGAGLVTEVAARPIIIDDTPPPTPIVYDQGAYINDLQPLEANWLWSPEDPESGTMRYQWALLEYGEKIEDVNWQDGDESKKIILTDFQQEHGKTYYFAVKAINSAGLSSIGLSDGIIVDATVPFLPKIKLLNAINLEDPSAEEVNYITTTEDLGLWIDSYDPESGIAAFYYTWGTREEVDINERQESFSERIILENPEIKDGVITIFAGESVNEAGDYSPTGYSTGVVLDTERPKVVNVHGFYSTNKLYFDWDVIASKSPVVKYEISLIPHGGLAENWQEITDGRSVVLDVENLEDGYYHLLVKAYNAAGSVSHRDEWGESSIITIDRTPPRITSFDYDQYVSSTIRSSIFGEDNLSGINYYQYAVGTARNPFQFTGGWKEVVPEEGNTVEFTVDTEEILHNTNLYLVVRARDNAGLWSNPVLSERILVDHTPPERPEISCGIYTNSQHRIADITFTGSDPESVITHYVMGVVTEEGDESLYDLEPIPIADFRGELINLNLIESQEYTVALSLCNAAGLWSEVSYSDPITVDTIPPELNFPTGGSELVLNQPPLDIWYHLSEKAEVELVLVLPNGTKKKDIRQMEAQNQFFCFEESEPGIYRLTAKAKDQAGNSSEEQVQIIRVNSPPTIIIPKEINTTPGQPIQFTPSVVDSDGEIVEYHWEPGDGGEPFYGLVFEYSYMMFGEYSLTLKVKDNDGAIVSETISVKVNNTVSGQLYTDETWVGEHRIIGDVFVPEGVTLSILPGTKVIIDGIPGVTGYNHALMVEGQLMINEDGPEVSFSSVFAAPNSWKGICLLGSATLNNLRIEHAVRGITVINEAQVSISNCYLLNNQVGVHVYSNRPQINNTRFERNTYYGIKEDSGGRPVVANCHFIENGIDYYHEELTALSMEQLNGIEGNSGNNGN